MAGAHIFFAFMQSVICDHAPAKRNVEDSDFVSAVPHSNHHTLGTASWQNHGSSPPAVCYCTALSCLSRSIKPLHFLRIVEQCKSKKTTHLPGHGYPRPALGLG